MIGPRSKRTLLTVTPFHWAYVTIVVLIIGPFTVVTMYCQDFFDGYVRTFVGPRFQRQFGFKMEVRRMYYRKKQPLSVFVIKDLKPDGEFAKLGVRNCDVPVGFFHMSDASLYRKLERSMREPVEVRFINCEEYEKEFMSGDLLLSNRVHRIVLWPKQEHFQDRLTEGSLYKSRSSRRGYSGTRALSRRGRWLVGCQL